RLLQMPRAEESPPGRSELCTRTGGLDQDRLRHILVEILHHGPGRILIRHCNDRTGVEREAGFEDRPIARAAAQVAGYAELQPLFCRAPLCFEQACKRHHKSCCAKAALRSMVLNERLLNGMEAPISRKAFHSHYMFAIQLVKKLNAGVDCFITEMV